MELKSAVEIRTADPDHRILKLGVLVAIEGIDGSGKGTQAARLLAHFQQQGVRTGLLSFPRYQQTGFGRKIGDFLNGKFGSLSDVHPQLVALMFAGDRFESRELIEQSIATHDLIICDRYVASNIAHQAAKASHDEAAELINWIKQLEYQIYRLPLAELTIFLDVPVPQAQQLIAAKSKRDYTDKSADLQEADGVYLQHVREIYLQLADGPGWHRIHCMDHDRLRSQDEITADLVAAVSQVL